MPNQLWLKAACLLAAISYGPAWAQPQWQVLPKSEAKTDSPALPRWQPLSPNSSGTAKPSPPAAPRWQPLPTPVPGSAPAPVLWKPVPPSEQNTPPAATSQSPQRQPPTSQAEAQALLRTLPLSSADYQPLLRLGMVPTASVLESNDFQITIGQVSPFSTGEGGGTGLQNYWGFIELGLAENLQLSAYYTQADDPLYAPIRSRQNQPENRWDSAGAALRWKFGESGPVSFGLEGALESFIVKSGGSNSVGSSATSCNIFNSNCTTPVETNNLVGSISAPISWQANQQLQFSLTPGVTFLPASQGNRYGSGQFYGTTLFLGAGASYRPISRVQFFASALLPLGPGNNSFTSDLSFSRVPIFTGGMRYSLNPRIALEGSLTNGYGATPSTAILALPSSNQILYAGRLIYTPSRPDAPQLQGTGAEERLSFAGLSVASASLIAAGTSRLRASFDSSGNLSSRYDVGFSDEFSFDLEVGQLKAGSTPSSSFAATYMTPGNATVRGAGTALLFSQPRGDAISSGLRMSYGRVLGVSEPGYQFVEWINTYQASKSLSLNLNPKLAWSGSQTPYGVGLSANWHLNSWLSVIPEANLAGQAGQSNWTIALRTCPSAQLCLDLYGTSALSFQGAGQLLSAAHPGLGLSMGLKF